MSIFDATVQSLTLYARDKTARASYHYTLPCPSNSNPSRFIDFFFIEIFFESKIIYYEDLNIEKFNHFIYILNERDYN